MKYYHIVSILTIVAVLMPCRVSAQYDPLFSHYYDMQTSFNPAAAGKDTKLNATLAYAMNLTGFEHNPQTAYIAADMPFQALNMRHGVGLKLMNDKLGLFTHQILAAQYAARKKLGKGWLAIGLQAGMLSEDFKGSGLDLENPSDDAFASSDINGNSLDLAAGIYYNTNAWYAGISMQHLNSPLVELGEKNELQIDPSYYLTAGYLLKLRHPNLSVATAMLVSSDLVTYRGDVSGRLIYNSEGKVLYAGLGYSPTNSVTVYVGGSFHGIMLGYSYEAYTNGIGIGHGSHELHVGYQTDVNLTPKGKNRHQAVRYL